MTVAAVAVTRRTVETTLAATVVLGVAVTARAHGGVALDRHQARLDGHWGPGLVLVAVVAAAAVIADRRGLLLAAVSVGGGVWAARSLGWLITGIEQGGGTLLLGIVAAIQIAALGAAWVAVLAAWADSISSKAAKEDGDT